MSAEKYLETEQGTDCNFFNLPNRTQELVKEFLTTNPNEYALRAFLDRSEDFRLSLVDRYPNKSEAEMLDPDFNLKEVDVCMRYYEFLKTSDAVA